MPQANWLAAALAVAEALALIVQALDQLSTYPIFDNTTQEVASTRAAWSDTTCMFT